MALTGESKEDILFHACDEVLPMNSLSSSIAKIASGGYRDKQEADIVGSGYVVKSLEAALWCFLKTDNFKDAILKSANLGDDADTTAAVCGQIAGAFYSIDGIPDEWLAKLAKREIIEKMAEKLFRKER